MSMGINTAEYTVSRKPVGPYLRNLLLAIAFYVAILAGYFGLLTFLSSLLPSSDVFLSILTVPFIPLLLFILYHTFWCRFVKVEEKYVIESAKITFSEVYGKKEVEKYSRLLSTFSFIGPAVPENREKWAGARCLEFRGNVKSPDSYVLVCEDEKEGRTAVFLEATNRAVQVMKFYNAQNTVVSTTLRI